MSKVAISGNASGTGTFTIQAPNSNTDRVLSLPDEAGTVLTSASDITQNSGPAFFARTVTAQSISNVTFTKVQFDVEVFDSDSCYDNATNYRFTPTVEGYYQINANLAFSGAAAGFTQAFIYRNGVAFVGGSACANNTQVGGLANASGIIYLNGSTDYVEFYAWQGSGGNLGLQTGLQSNTFSGCLVRKA